MAAVEAALVAIFVLVPLTLCVIEGGRALSAYTSLNEASRAAARRIVAAGDASDVDALVFAVAGELDPEHLNTNVTMDRENDRVTVEVAYAHQWMLESIAQYGGYEDLTFTSSTSMPLP
jgi:Flp pilus assembly protein TadG